MRAAAVAMTLLLAARASSASVDDKCVDPPDTFTMSECNAKVYAAVDKELNAAYKEVEKRLADDADAKKLLVAAERAWIGYRDAECEFDTSSGAGGTLRPSMVSVCKAALTDERTKRFKAFLKCDVGDLTCPVPPPAK